MYCCVNSASVWGIEPYIVKIEADVSNGMPYFNMVGLLGSEVKESRERVRTAMKNSGVSFPVNRITVNLSPADRKKEGTGFDLPIAVSILCAMGRLDISMFEGTLIMGELGLDGEIKPVRGILPVISMAKKCGISRYIIPEGNRNEGGIISSVNVISFRKLAEIIDCFEHKDLKDDIFQTRAISRSDKICNKNADTYSVSDIQDCFCSDEPDSERDYSQIIGQEAVKRALLIAAAGWHNILMIGPPGVGKSMLASRIPSIMPVPDMEEQLEISGIHSICGLLEDGRLVMKRPFSAPHHSITSAALIGGGRIPKPGEITIAHKGVLFLDELPEFHPKVIDLLRQPLEEKVVKIHRTGGSYIFPADCLLVAAMNPCRCGYFPDRNKCNCSEHDIDAYLSRISGPLLDRIDMSIEVPQVKLDDMQLNEIMHHAGGAEMKIMSSEDMRIKVDAAMKFQINRQGRKHNGRLTVDEIKKYCMLDYKSSEFMKEAYRKFGLSMRGYYKIIKVARTIADIEESEKISITHLAESLAYRMSDKKYFNK